MNRMIVAFTEKVNNPHVAKMYDRQGNEDLARDAADAQQQGIPAMNRLPCFKHQRGIAKVQQVIAYQQHLVDKVCKLRIAMQ